MWLHGKTTKQSFGRREITSWPPRFPNCVSKMREIVAEGIRELVVDLADVHMVDSSGIGLLISAYNSLRKVGGRLAVIHASAEILELFQTMRMHQHFSVSGN